MSTIMVERSRWGSRYARALGGPNRYRDLEDASLRGPKSDAKNKALNENFGPLLRFLGRRVGRPWNHVYSATGFLRFRHRRFSSGRI